MSRNVRYYMDPNGGGAGYTFPVSGWEAAQEAPLPSYFPATVTPGGYGYGAPTYMDPFEVLPGGQIVTQAQAAQAQPLQAGVPLAGVWALIMAGLQAGKGLLPLIQQYAPWLLGAAGAAAVVPTAISAISGMGYTGQVVPGTAIPLGGWGAAEPPAAMIAKQWRGIGGSEFYLLINGRVVVRKANGVWKLVRRVKMLHMKTTNPRMGDVVKADKIVARVAKILRRRLK